jgi:hypothetical protein
MFVIKGQAESSDMHIGIPEMFFEQGESFPGEQGISMQKQENFAGCRLCSDVTLGSTPGPGCQYGCAQFACYANRPVCAAAIDDQDFDFMIQAPNSLNAGLNPFFLIQNGNYNREFHFAAGT